LRYGELHVTCIYNDRLISRAENALRPQRDVDPLHTPGADDGACTAYHFPGTFYDYYRDYDGRRDMPSVWPTTIPG
jgi:hypothetical protein